MPTITDWLMVIITFIYVVATIFICWTNFNSAKASKEELNEIKRQYAEDNRPRIEVEFCYERRTWYIVRFVNHGKLTAQHVKIELDEEFINSLPDQAIRDVLLMQKFKESIIGVEQHYDLYIASNALKGYPNMKPVTGKLTYQDGNRSYESDIYIDMENYATFFSSSYDDPVVNELKYIKKEIEGIKSAVSALDVSAKVDNQTNKKAKPRIKYKVSA